MAEWEPGAAQEVTLPARLELDWGEASPRTLTFRRTDSEGSVSIGYVSAFEHVPAAGTQDE